MEKPFREKSFFPEGRWGYSHFMFIQAIGTRDMYRQLTSIHRSLELDPPGVSHSHFSTLFSGKSIEAISQRYAMPPVTPCSCAHRWSKGAHWNLNGTINDLPNAPPALGIIRCGSSAETENQLQQHACLHDQSQFNILLGADCYQPLEGSIPEGRTTSVNSPVDGKDIIWLNFDIRPFAGSFQYQITPGNGELGWALYYGSPPQAGVNPPSGGNPDSLSGNCSDLTYVDCGISATGWVTFTVPSLSDPSNYYIALWRNNGQNFTNQNVTFKGRFGCGDSPVVFCLLEESNTTISCNPDGSYTVTTVVEGINGTYIAVDNTNTPGVTFSYSPDPLILNNLSVHPTVITGTIMATYPAGQDYDFTIYETSGVPINSSGNIDTLNECQITVFGIAPDCCQLLLDSVLVFPQTCVDSLNGAIHVFATGAPNIEYSIDGVNFQSGNIFNGLPGGIYNVYIRVATYQACTDELLTIFIPVLLCQDSIEICEGTDIQLQGIGYADSSLVVSYYWTGPNNFSSTEQHPIILSTSPFYPGPGNFTYTLTLTCSYGCSGTYSINVTVVEMGTVTLQADNHSFCVGDSATLTAETNGGDGCSTLWQVILPMDDNWQTFQTGGLSYILPSSLGPGTYQYRVLYTNCTSSACPAAVSNVDTIVIIPFVDIMISASDTSYCEGGISNLSAIITGTEDCDISWEFRVGISGPFSVIPGSTNSNPFEVSASLSPGVYQFRAYLEDCELIAICGNDTSNTITIIIADDPEIIAQPNDITECIGDDQAVSVMVAGGTGLSSYQWQVSSNGFGNWSHIEGATNSNYIPSSLDPGTFYFRVIITFASEGCDLIVSDVATVIILEAIEVSISVDHPVVCVDGFALLTSEVTNGSGDYLYQWQQSPTGLNIWMDIPVDGNLPTYTVFADSAGSADYRLVLVYAEYGCGLVVSDPITITMINPPNPDILGNTLDTICSGGSLFFQAVDIGIEPITYTWTFGSGSNPGTISGIGPHQVEYTYDTINGSTGAWVVLTISTPGCEEVSDTVANIHVNAIPNSVILASPGNPCILGSKTFQPQAELMEGFTYLWNFGAGADPATATGYGPHIIEYFSSGSKTVKLVVHSNEQGASCADSSTITFTVNTCPGNITGKVMQSDGTPIASVNLRLYADQNLDGIQDNNTIVRSVFTNSGGVYSMATIIPGYYVIVQTQPAGYFSLYDEDATEDYDSLSNVIPNDNIIPVTVEPGEVDADNNFVEVSSPGIISGYVFEDFDNNQIPAPVEGIQGVILHVYSDTDQNGLPDAGGLLSTTTSSSIGYYTFGDLPVGNYVIVEEQPVDYINIKDFDATNDNDVVPNTNMTDDIIPVTINNAETDADNYFIEISFCSGTVTNLNDGEPGSLRYMIDCINTGDTIFFHPVLLNQTLYLNEGRLEIDKNMYIHSDLNPRLMIHSNVNGAIKIFQGNSVFFRNINLTSGLSGFPGAAIENYGNLTLWDVFIYRNLLLPATDYLLFNGSSGQVTVEGNVRIEPD